MTAPVPEENDEPTATQDDRTPPGEHPSEMTEGNDATPPGEQEENAETSLDEPSDGSGGE
ncbi:hypothetical protein [Nocardioides conyzicola]